MNKTNQTSLYYALQEELLNAFLYMVIFLFVCVCEYVCLWMVEVPGLPEQALTSILNNLRICTNFILSNVYTWRILGPQIPIISFLYKLKNIKVDRTRVGYGSISCESRWTVVLEKTPESPLDCKEIQAVHPKGDQSWVFFGRTDAEAETPIL